MIRAILKISIRNILKHRIYSAINVFGLSLGFAAFILIGLFIRYELSWDKSNDKYDRIYRVQRYFPENTHVMNGNEISQYSRAITAQLLEKRFPEFEKISVIHHAENSGNFLASVPDLQIYDEKGICADSCFFDVFTYHFLEGTQTGALDEPFSIVLSKSMANKLYPEESALGRTVTVEKKFDLKVTGVYADLPENSSLRPTHVISFPTLAKTDGITRSSIWSSECMTYALLKPGVDFRYLESKTRNAFVGFKDIEHEELQLCPMSKIYLSFNGRNDYVIILSFYGLIGLFILIMSSFNYINLTTANAANRGKEIAMKKVSGSNRFALVSQFLGEAVLISFLALGVAFLLAKIFLPVFSGIIGRQLELDLYHDEKFVGLTILISLGVGLLSGIYPALFLSSHKIVSLFKGEMFGRGREKLSLKKVLVTFQFAISAFLILITISVSLHISYLLKKDLGFSKENMLYTRMSVSKQGTTFDQLRNRILQHPEIVDASMSKNVPFVSFGGGMTNWEGSKPDENVLCRFNDVSYDFVKNMGISLVAGRDFSHGFPGDVGKSCLINETAARCFGWENPIGKRVKNNRLTVIGVVKDYIYKDMHNGIEPAILVLAPEEIAGTWTFAFRVERHNQQKAKAILTSEFENAFPNDSFEFNDLPTTFANDYVFKVYHAINHTILFFTVFNIFLAMIGLLGLVSFTVIRRTKEIGVRKINGSTSLSIFYLLSREYFILLCCALVIAFPSALWILGKLPGTYKLPPQPWIYVLAAGIIFVIILLTTCYHTIKAATRNPVEALRYE